jgi:predicted AAA+ superfamily ATPase
MAVSNRDRVGKLFELLAPPLDRFIGDAVATVLKPGATWTSLVALKDQKKGISGKEYRETDPQVQLRMLTENIPHQLKSGWYPFDDAIGHVGQGYAKELREYRNDWAHNAPFTDDDAYRCLDTGERFLKLIGAADVADQVQAIRLSLRRLTADKADKKVIQAVGVAADSGGVRPWRDVLPPHDDVATGNFQAAEFAADLYKVSVSSADAGGDYADPVAFFERTYLTEGLRDLIGRACRRLAGDDNASPVINLQTNFGGGKTHSMLALWHLAAGLPATEYGQELQELLAAGGYEQLGTKVGRVALVGNHVSPSGTTKPDGTVVNTLWGELAWQLGGADAYQVVAQADRERTPPGEALHELLAAHAPAVILIDEWVAYARSLVGRDDLAGGTFDDQFTFAQALTEAVKGTSGVLLAISIPASESGQDSDKIVAGNAEEVGGSHGLEALKRLQNVVRRVADQWRPASADESYRIVQQRLFQRPDAEALAAIGATARSFGELYRKHHGEFPSEAQDYDYEERIKKTYPIHPELFDRLYEDWSSLERFQRTRGVLRLMNAVIHALWTREDQSPLILPASVPLQFSDVNSELTQYLQDSWKAIIDADVAGEQSEPARIDKEKPLLGGRSITQRLARTVFFGAAPTIGSAHKGLEGQRVFLGTAVPGDTVGNYHSALNQLADRATYFYAGSGRYWYDLQANVTRRAKEHADRLQPEVVWAEIVSRLRGQERHPGAFAGVHVCPDEIGDIRDLDEARLVIVHPKLTHARKTPLTSASDFALRATESRGSGSRTYRNMLVFLAADGDRMQELDQATRTYLGWTEILDKSADLDLTENQRRQAEEKQRQAGETVDARLLGAYQWALVPHGQPIEIATTKVDGQAPWLAERVARRLGNDGELATQHAARNVRMRLDDNGGVLWKDGHVTVGALWRVYAEYPYMPRLRDQEVLKDGLRSQDLLWQDDGFALAEGYDGETDRYVGLILPTDQRSIQITDDTLIVQPDRAIAQRTADEEAARARSAASDEHGGGDGDQPLDTGGRSGATGTPTAPQDGAGNGVIQPPAPPRKTRFYGTKQLSTDRYALDFKHLADEVLAPLIAAHGANVRVTVEIEATAPKGFDDGKVRTVSENATTLKFDQSGFEES